MVTAINKLRSAQFLNISFLGLGLVLLLWAAWLFAQLTWRLLLPTEAFQQTPLNTELVAANHVAAVDIQRIQALHLFGVKGAAVEQNRTGDAPVTTLNIRLVGVSASNNPNLSAAIIQQGAEQSTYISGDTISNSRAVVQKILSDRVLLEHNNRLETLWLEGRDGSEVALVLQSQATQQNNATMPTNQAAAGVTLNKRQQDILAVISITPQQGEEGLLGYRLAPKGDEALFLQFGLRTGDLAVAMNGYDLTNMAESLELISKLEGLTQAQVRILRDGEYVDIDIYIPEE